MILVGSVACAAAAATLVGLYQVSERLAVSGLMAMAGACELGGVALVVAEVRDRGRTINAHLARYRRSQASRPTLSPSEPFHNAPSGRGPFQGAPIDSMARDVQDLQRRVTNVEHDIRHNVTPRVNRAVERAEAATSAGDRDLEGFVIALTKGNRGKTRLSVLLLGSGIVLGIASNVWSMQL